jgi:hypothetical protein
VHEDQWGRSNRTPGRRRAVTVGGQRLSAAEPGIGGEFLLAPVRPLRAGVDQPRGHQPAHIRSFPPWRPGAPQRDGSALAAGRNIMTRTQRMSTALTTSRL